MSKDCPVCEELWRDYVAATSEHVVAENTLKLALLDGDQQAVTVLRKQTESTFQRKAKLRDAIRKHDIDAHGAMARTL